MIDSERNRWRAVLVSWAASRVVCYAIAYIASYKLHVVRDLYQDDTHLYWYSPVRWIDTFARYDVRHYDWIATHGYDIQYRTAFFPLYPLFLRGLHALGWEPILVGAAVSHLCLLGSLILLTAHYRRFSPWLLCAVVVLSPATIIFSVPQTDAFFFLLVCLVIVSAELNRAWPAAIATAVSSALRPQGMVLAAFEGLVFLQRRNWRWLLAGLIGITGLACYMFYLWRSWGDPLAFIHAQQTWQRSTTWPWLALFRFHDEPDHFVCAFVGIALIALRVRRRADWPTTALATAMLLMPLSTGSMQSFPRFYLSIVPLQIELLEDTTPKWLRNGFLLFSAVYAIINAWRWGTGQFPI